MAPPPDRFRFRAEIAADEANNEAAIEQGLRLDAVFDNTGDQLALQNIGIAAGVMGNISLFKYRIEYRDYRGSFKPAFFNNLYDRQRADYAREVIADLQGRGTADATKIFGIFGEGGFDIPEVLSMEFGYLWPWERLAGGGIQFAEEDFLNLEATLAPGVIPKIDIHGSVFYNRTKFIPTLQQAFSEDPVEAVNALTLFDENTAAGAELIYSAAPSLDLAIVYTATLARDEDTGELLDENGDGKSDVALTLSIETRVSF